MSERAYGFDVYDDGITAEESAISRWETDMNVLMQEDWEQIMGGPEDAYFEMMEARSEAAYEDYLKLKEMVMAEEEPPDVEPLETGCGKEAVREPVIVNMDEDDIPF